MARMLDARIQACGEQPLRSILFAVAWLLFVMVDSGCQQRRNEQVEQERTSTMNPATANDIQTTASATQPNELLLDEANAAAKWFHAKKTRPIWARRLEEAQTVKTLEGEEQVTAGHYLCKGEAGDIWPQTEKNLNKRYSATDEVTADGWRKYQPHPDAQGVMATQIDHPFEVQATWGKLSGKPGDFLLKNFSDRETAYPDDVWLVDQTLFQQTYETMDAQ